MILSLLLFAGLEAAFAQSETVEPGLGTVGESRGRALATALKALLDGQESEAVLQLLALHEARPDDDDVAYWLARVHYQSGRSAEALELLEERTGNHVPACRLRSLEARARVVLGQFEEALGLLEACKAEWRLDPERRTLAAILGLLRLEHGDVPEGVDALQEAGGDPWPVLDEPMRESLAGAGDLRVVEISREIEGRVEVGFGGDRWQVDLQTGLARKGAHPWPVVELPGDAGSSRTEAVPCRGGWAWSSPSEDLDSGRAGVYLWTRAGLEILALSPLPGADDAPTCAGGEVFFLRRVMGVTQAMHWRDEQMTGLDFEGVSVASLDARAQGSVLELLLGVVVEGEPAVFWTRADLLEPERLFASSEAPIAPRWVHP